MAAHRATPDRPAGVEAATGLRGGIRPLIFPRSAALVGSLGHGAGATVAGAVAGSIPVWGVNPRRPHVPGLEVVGRLEDLPEVPELAFVLVGHRQIEAVVEGALAAGVRGLVVPGLGNEAGAEGPVIAGRVAAAVSAAGAAMVGPNCMGVGVPRAASFWIGTVPATFLPGRVSVLVQSGSVGEALLALGPRIGFRCVVSSGAEASRDAADFCGFFAEDEGTEVVGLFLETVRRPAAFVAALEQLALAGKPVVVLKVGRSESAARAVMAHTGAMVGPARAFSAALRRLGAIEVTDFADFVEVLELLGRGRRPRGRRLGGVSNSGGEGALLLDLAEASGLPFAPLSPALAGRLRDAFPNYIAPGNPVDAWAIDAEERVFPGTLELLAGSGEFDILVAHVDQSQFLGEPETASALLILRSLAEAVEGRPVAAALTSLQACDPGPVVAAAAAELGVPLLRGAAASMRALAAVAAIRPPYRPPAARARIDISDLARAGGALPELESGAILERYGVPLARRQRAASPAEAAAAAVALGGRVVVKVDGPAHKAGRNGVLLGIEGSAAAEAAAVRLGGGPVLVAEQVAAGPEAFCGMVRDPGYGPILAVGLGGGSVERLGLAAVCAGPLDLDGARELVRAAPHLSELGSPAALDDLARVIEALGRLATEHPEVSEIDVNPLVLGAGGAIAVDALVVLEGG